MVSERHPKVSQMSINSFRMRPEAFPGGLAALAALGRRAVLRSPGQNDLISRYGDSMHDTFIHDSFQYWNFFRTSTASSINSFSKTSKWILMVLGAKQSRECACFVSVVSNTLLLS